MTDTSWPAVDESARVRNSVTLVVQVDGNTVRIHGESERASSLIGLIEESALLKDARFSSPVTKNPRTSNDRFVIEAVIDSGEGAQ